MAQDQLPDRKILSDQALDTIFREARSQNKWLDKPVSDTMLHAVYDLMKWGPTSANCSPARIVFVKGPDAKEKLVACVSEGNKEKTRTAPVVAIIGYDARFYEKLPELFPHNPDAKNWFTSSEEMARITAMRNGTLQGAYLMIAARALGLDCGPMSGFDHDAVDKAFFPDGRIKSNFLCGLGYGDPAGVFERLPRLSFSEACKIL
ncbi:MAG: malonic semialdehyde reductase [Alphaproteobacteria bacterium]|nr:MAG: malonic semialdehyde reductase [Alphaproteobacteria bacterium]